MFCVIYTFKVFPHAEARFEEAWRELTYLIRDFEGGLGSRLHREEGGDYVAYAQWPSQERWEQSGGRLPAEAEKWRKQMKETCSAIEMLRQFQMVTDLLVRQ
jgi:heme-degrading monooxygenase HmoA